MCIHIYIHILNIGNESHGCSRSGGCLLSSPTYACLLAAPAVMLRECHGDEAVTYSPVSTVLSGADL